MLTPHFSDEVQVVLTAVDAPSTQAFRERCLLLTRDNPTIFIGRTSKRNASLEPAHNNAWIDSAVMSRDHALLKLDIEDKKVFIQDIGSLHGTFQNNVRLDRDQLQPLQQGDVLRFGIAVERSAQTFPPCVMKVTLNYGTQTRPEGKPVVFKVPDDSDIEEISSDDDLDLSIGNSTRILCENGIRPAQPASTSNTGAIDLTYDEENAVEEHASSETHMDARLTSALPPWATTSQTRLVDEDRPAILQGQGLGLKEQQRELMDQHTPAVVESRNDGSSSDSDRNEKQADGDAHPTDADDREDCSSVVSPLVSALEPPSHDSSAVALAGTSDNDMISTFDSDEECESDDAFGFDQVSSSPVGSSPHATCDCDGTMPERTVTGQVSNLEMDSSVNTATKPESPMAKDTDQSAEYCCDPANTLIFSADAEQSSVHSRPEKLPFLAPGQSLGSGRVQLRPIVDDTVMAAPMYSQQPSVQSTAEALGQKTGKFEYFSARDHNKLIAGTSFRHSVAQPSPPMAAQTSNNSNRIRDDNAHVEDTDKDCQGHQGPQELDSSFLSPNEKVGSFMDAHTSALLASGAKFLSSPPKEPETKPLASSSPELDETSAYQFELSKKAAETNATTSRRTQVASHDLVDATAGKPSDEGRPCHKRKADNISKLTIEEERRVAEAAKGPVCKSSAANLCPLETASRAVTVAETSVSRPTKRLRRVAEVFGYAALGGVAVVSALIATAPTL